MIQAILFDLDGTLLPIDMEEFLKNYLKLLSEKLKNYIKPTAFIDELMAATSAMIRNEDFQKCNAEVFAEAFFTATALSEDELMPVFEDFYLNEYCQIGQDIKPLPIVREIIEIVKRKGYVVVLATNPLFPLIAVKERIKWAGLEPDAFTLITSYENMHAAKPNPQYYKEIAEKIGIEPKHCLMVGNDVEEDLVAKTIGMQTFLVKDHLINSKKLPIVTDYEGNLEDLLKFVTELKSII